MALRLSLGPRTLSQVSPAANPPHRFQLALSALCHLPPSELTGFPEYIVFFAAILLSDRLLKFQDSIPLFPLGIAA